MHQQSLFGGVCRAGSSYLPVLNRCVATVCGVLSFIFSRVVQILCSLRNVVITFVLPMFRPYTNMNCVLVFIGCLFPKYVAATYSTFAGFTDMITLVRNSKSVQRKATTLSADVFFIYQIKKEVTFLEGSTTNSGHKPPPGRNFGLIH